MKASKRSIKSNSKQEARCVTCEWAGATLAPDANAVGEKDEAMKSKKEDAANGEESAAKHRGRGKSYIRQLRSVESRRVVEA